MKRFKFLILVYLIFLSEVKCYSQNDILSLGLWNLSAVSGELKLGALYGQGSTDVYGLYNKSQTTKLYGGIILKTTSYIWNPNFLKLEIDGAYYPMSNRNEYLIFPTYYDVYNANRLHLSATFFEKKPVSLNMYMNLEESYDSRENLTDIRSNSKSYGGMLSMKYKILPVTVSYNQNDWDSRELATGRTYSYNQKNWDARIVKSFGRRDRNELLYTRHDYTRKDYNIDATRNVYDNLELRNKYNLDKAMASYINSDIVGTSQVGVDSYKQLRLTENFLYKLPHDMKINGGYSYINTQRTLESLVQNNFNTVLSHQLFLSLHTDLMYEYIGNIQSTYKEDNNKVGISFSYNKKIPTDGYLTLSYAYSITNEKRTSDDAILQIMNEPYILADNQVVMIKQPYVDVNSIKVKDESGTHVFVLNIDYVLNVNNNYVEIQRIPGGQIPNNTTVYLFYSAKQPGNVQYNLSSNNFMANVSFFGQLISFYYSTYRQDYFNVSNTDNLNLNYLANDIYGSRFAYKFITLGAEFNDYRSSIYPYKILRYYIQLQGNYHNRLNYAINLNSREYLKLPTDSTHRLYEDINGMVSYTFNSKTKFDINAGYQYQDGKDLNLSLITARLKFTKIIKSLIFTIGVDMFKREYLLTQKSDYLGGYFQVVKKF